MPGPPPAIESSGGPVTPGDSAEASLGQDPAAFLERFASTSWLEYAHEGNGDADLAALAQRCPPFSEADAADWVNSRPNAQRSKQSRAQIILFQHLVEYAPSWFLARRLWNQAEGPMARACLFCETKPSLDRWGDDPVFAAQVLEAMEGLAADGRFLPYATDVTRSRLRKIDWARAARHWAPKTWLHLLKFATRDFGGSPAENGRYLSTYTSAGAPPMPKNLLSELLESPAAEVRIWAQCEIARHGGTVDGREEPVRGESMGEEPGREGGVAEGPASPDPKTPATSARSR